MIKHDNKTINAWWMTKPDPGNFGDILTPYIIKKLSGYSAVYTPAPFNRPVFIAVGSIASRASNMTTIWGSGVMSLSERPSNEATYLAVRGPITRELILSNGGKCPEIYGDPGLLLPKFYNKTPRKKYKIGFIPHYVDYDQVKSWYNSPDIKIINLLDSNIHNVIDQILECEMVVSSSLHGIITAVAYGVPASWVVFSDKLKGDGSKFQDFFQSIGVKHDKTVMLERPKTFDDWEKLPYISTINIDLNKLIEAFPK